MRTTSVLFGGWGIWVMIVVALSVIWIIYLVFSQSKAAGKIPDGEENADLTGHRWDEEDGYVLEEYDNPLPKWWLWMFYLLITTAVLYLTLYPGFGLWRGLFGWSSVGQYREEVKQANASFEPIFEQYMSVPIEELSKNPVAIQTASNLFKTYCIQCHGSNAKGQVGFPNLTDKDWLYGGSPAEIQQTITNGRLGVMPARGGLSLEDIGGSEGIKDVANYVLSLSGSTHDVARAKRGEVVFKKVCFSCHGADGKGNKLIGAPNLTDKIWLHGSSEEAIIKVITNGVQNQMPAWKTFLGDARIHLLTAYVWGLSNNK